MDDGLTAPDWAYETFEGAYGSEDHIHVSVKEALNEWIGTGGSQNGYHLPFLGTKEWMDGGSDEYWKDDFKNWIESLPLSGRTGRSKYTVNNPKVSPFSRATYWNPRGYPAWVVKKVSIEDYIQSDPDDDYPVWLWTTSGGRKFLHDKNAGVVFTEEGNIIGTGQLTEDNFREGDTLEMLLYYDAGPRKRNIRLALNWLVWPEILTRRKLD